MRLILYIAGWLWFGIATATLAITGFAPDIPVREISPVFVIGFTMSLILAGTINWWGVERILAGTGYGK